MKDMSDSLSEIQVVFLIDVFSQTLHENESDYTCRIKRISLPCFRLLSHFASICKERIKNSKRKTAASGLRWGYKFYNSRSLSTKVETYSWRDFKIRHFEDFEGALSGRFENILTSSRLKKSASSNNSPAVCLNRALTELLYDFQWEKPDITSPVKVTRSHSRLENSVQQTRNFVLLLSECPHNVEELETFCQQKNSDSEFWISSIIPPALFLKFHQTSKLTIHWVDTSNIFNTGQLSQVINIQTIESINKSLTKLGGKLIPLSALLQLGLQHDTSLHQTLKDFKNTRTNTNKYAEASTNEESKEECSNTAACLLPTSATIEYYLNLAKKKTKEHVQENITCNLYRCIGDQTTFICCLSIRHASKEKCHRIPNSSNQAKTGSFPSVNLQLTANSQIAITRSTSSRSGKSSLLSENGRTSLVIYACISTCGPFLSDVVSDDVYVCTGQKTKEAEKQFCDFQFLVKELGKQDKCLLVQIKKEGAATVHSGILQVLTATSASLSILPLGRTLDIEKSLKFTADDVVTQSKITGIEAKNVLVSKLLDLPSSHNSYSSGKNDPEVSASNKAVCFDARKLDSWMLPGLGKSVSQLVTKLNTRIEKLDFLNEQEKRTLKQLQKIYHKENQPISLMQEDTQEKQMENNCDGITASEENKYEADLTIHDVHTQPYPGVTTRGDLMLSQSRQVIKKKLIQDENQVTKETKKERAKPEIAQVDFHSEDELLQYAQDLYNKCLEDQTAIDMCAQTVVMVTSHFMNHHYSDDPQQKAQEFLHSKIIVQNSVLRDKYQLETDDKSKQLKITEYQLQIFLRLELLSVLVDKDDTESDVQQEVVMLLRSLSFVTPPAFIPEFLKNMVIENFIHTLPKTLIGIYDELMQPIPDALSQFLSPNNSADQSTLDNSVFNDTLGSNTSVHSHGPSSNLSSSMGPPSLSSQPPSNGSDILLSRSFHNLRNRRLAHHPSLSDMGSKRQIVVAKTVQQPKEKSSRSSRSSNKKSTGEDVKKVCRNLFENDRPKLERRKSVAVMERTKQNSRRERNCKNPRSKSKYAKVAETPAHKQVSQSIWERQERRRQRGQEVTSVEVVEESPIKMPKAQDLASKSPSRSKMAIQMMRRSFYSAGPSNRSRNFTKGIQQADVLRSQNLSKSIQLADRIGGRQRAGLKSLLSQSMSAGLKSPGRRTSTFFLSQLIGTPSPKGKTTPSKRLLQSAEKCLVLNSPNQSASLINESLFKSPSHSVIKNTPKKSPFGTPRSCLKQTPIKKGSAGKRVLFSDSPVVQTNRKTPSTPIRENTAIFNQESLQDAHCSTPKKQSSHVKKLLQSPESCKPFSPLPITPKKSTNQKIKISSTDNCDRGDNFVNINSQRFESPSRYPLRSLTPIKSRTATNGFKECSEEICEVLVTSSDVTSNSVQELSKQLQMTPSPKDKPILKTPSPNKKTVVKTPDSFDKWPRRKPLLSCVQRHVKCETITSSMTLRSPKQGMQTPEKLNVKRRPFSKSSSINFSPATDVSVKLDLLNADDSKLSVNISKKRSIDLSPDQGQDTPSKRRRKLTTPKTSASSRSQRSLLTSVQTRLLQEGSQSGIFYPSLDCQSMFSSQSSDISLNNYFSSSCDEVFLMDTSVMEHKHSHLRTFSPTSETLLRDETGEQSSIFPGINNEPNLLKDISRSSSFTSKDAGTLLTVPTSPDLIVMEIASSDSEPEPPSLPINKSPNVVKFSQNVSAKSLMHLMQSPLVSSGESSKDSPISGNAHSRLKCRQHSKSRRSLQLQK